MLRQLLNGQRAALWYVVLVVCLPVLTLLVLGLIQLWQNQWLVSVSIVWLVITLAGFALYKFWPEKQKTNSLSPGESSTEPEDTSLLTSLPVRLEPRPDWTELDKRVWIRAVQAVELVLDTSPDWQALPEHCVQMLSTISQYYDLESRGLGQAATPDSPPAANASYSFTLPEMLLVLSVTSSRYRQLLLSHVPFADRIRVSSLLSVYAHQDKIVRGAGLLNTVRRTARFANPLAAVAAELRDQFTNRIFTNLSDKVQNDLKRLLLQELSQVAMDLYSGRLKHSADELQDYVSHSQVQDVADAVSPAEPLRVVLIGQVSAGKSSLVNALAKRLEAETDILPTTNRSTVHVLHWNDESAKDDKNKRVEPLHLIDTTGLSDNPQSLEATAAIAQQADLLLWVMRATQPARAPEAALYSAVNQAFAAQPNRRPPPILLVMTHIDQLSPKGEWNPPYDLTGDNRKAQTISRALESCKQQIGLPAYTPAVPVCLAEHRQTYNTDVVAAQLMMQQTDATLAQLNRRRTEKDSTSGSWRERWEQASRLGTVTGKLLVRSVRG